MTKNQCVGGKVFTKTEGKTSRVSSNLGNITHVTTQVCMILRNYAVFMWMRDQREILVACDVVE